jgi:hypothetical protein
MAPSSLAESHGKCSSLAPPLVSWSCLVPRLNHALLVWRRVGGVANGADPKLACRVPREEASEPGSCDGQRDDELDDELAPR